MEGKSEAKVETYTEMRGGMSVLVSNRVKLKGYAGLGIVLFHIVWYDPACLSVCLPVCQSVQNISIQVR